MVVGAIALGGVAAVGVTWWLARSIGGPVAGLVAGLLMAVSSSAINETTFIWNPNLIALSSSVALAGAWQAHRTGREVVDPGGRRPGRDDAVPRPRDRPRAAAGRTLPARSSAQSRGRVPKATPGRRAAAVAVVVIGYLPLIAHELGNGFSETRAALAFLTAGGQPVALSLPARLLFVGLRIVAWPLEGS